MPSTPPTSAPAQSPADAGFTLVEVMISVALFGLIAMAGFTLLDSELRVQSRVDGRLERLGDMQRAMYVMTSDLEQMSGAEVQATADGLAFRRYATAPSPAEVAVRYALKDGVVERTLGGMGAQRLLTDVASLRWTFYVDGQGWQDTWPEGESSARPAAVAIDIALKGAQGERGVLRRLVQLPAKP